MKKISILFLQGVLVLIGVVVLFILIKMPPSEGKAQNLDLISIYTDPVVLYGYASSVVFFVGLYKAFKLVGYIGNDRLFSTDSIKSLRIIRYCAIIMTFLVVLAALYINLFHDKNDDPAGFLGMSMVVIFINTTIAIAVTVLENIVQKAIDMKSENDLTI